MCQHPMQRFDGREHHHGGCPCSCPAAMDIGEEIRVLEEHKKILLEQVAIFDKKIAALKAAKGS